MITVSEPIVTSSPIATPSWMRTWLRMSHERPRIAPSRMLERPTCVEESITVRVVRDDFEVSGEQWSYDHAAKTVTIGKNARNVIRATLPDIIR